MKNKIKWKYFDKGENATARVGDLILTCYVYQVSKKSFRWKCSLSLGHIYAVSGHRVRHGKHRKSMAKSQQEAEKMAQEFVMDIRESLKETMKHFGLDGV